MKIWECHLEVKDRGEDSMKFSHEESNKDNEMWVALGWGVKEELV